MLNHPNQRKIDPRLSKKGYIKSLKANMISLQLEYEWYLERDDRESCQEIQDEYTDIFNELKMFLVAWKKSEQYHRKC